jgi:hypothetical protein
MSNIINVNGSSASSAFDPTIAEPSTLNPINQQINETAEGVFSFFDFSNLNPFSSFSATLPTIDLTGLTETMPVDAEQAKAIGLFTLGLAVGLAAPKMIGKLMAEPKANPDVEIRKTFQKLMIKEWHLPGLSSQLPIHSDNSPKPIFNDQIQAEIDVVKQRMEKAKDTDGRSPLPNLILKGKPGVGKTMLLENLCVNSGVGFIRIPSGAMETHLKTGSHITALHDIFNVAELCGKPIYLIMDDGEQLVAKRPEINNTVAQDGTKAAWILDKEKMSETIVQRRIALVNAILEESGKDLRQLGFAITTNRPDAIDDAFITRSHTLAISPPEFQERKDIIITHLPSIFENDMDILPFFDKRILTEMARKTEGFTGRNIVKMLEDLYACIKLENDITEELIDASIVSIQETLAGNRPIAVSEKAPVELPAIEDDKIQAIANKTRAMANGMQWMAEKVKQSAVQVKKVFSE